MTDLRTAAQQALEALKMMRDQYEEYACPACDHADAAIYALRAALAEPVALDWLHKWANYDDGEPETQWHEGYEAARRVVQIHLTAPPQRKPLTEEEIYRLFRTVASPVMFARAVERAHGIT